VGCQAKLTPKESAFNDYRLKAGRLLMGVNAR